jgi:PKD repeat protein
MNSRLIAVVVLGILFVSVGSGTVAAQDSTLTSPVNGVSDELWTEVTGDGTLALGDLGNAIHEYQDNEEINGVDISLGDLGTLIQYYQSSPSAGGNTSVGENRGTIQSIENEVTSGGDFEVTVETSETATTAIEASSANMNISLSVIDSDSDPTKQPSDTRVEFIDIGGDGGTYSSTLKAPNSTGGETVDVTAYAGGNANEGDNNDTETTEVTILTPPTASFSYSPTAPSTSEKVNFDASGSSDPDGTVVSYDWDFGDGTTASGESVTHSYSSSGEYTVELTVTDDDGGTDTVTRVVSVNEAPTASFEYSPQSPSTSETVNFDASDSSDPDGNIQSYSWSFGDGTTAGGVTESHSYTSSDEYAVTLTVTDDEGAVDTATQTVSVGTTSSNSPPTASFEYTPNSPNVSDTIEFDGSASSDPDGSIQSYEWDFNGDGVTDGTGEKTSHSYSSSGDYTVTLTVTDDEGATDTTTQTVSVNKEETETSPTAEFTYSPNSPAVSEEVTFDASTSSDDGTIQSYLWDFNGDGLTDATGQTASHKFTDSGDYTVELTVTDGQGLSDTVTNTVTVEESGSTVGNISINHPATVTPDGEFSLTLQMPQVATSAVEVVSSNFSVSLSGDGTEANTASEDLVRREFIDVQADGGSYDVTVDIENSSEGDTGSITAYAGGEGNETDHNAKQVSTFSVSESGDSPIDGVSDRLWTEVTGGGELTLGDLGTAIQQYQQNGEINGVSISLGDLGSLIQHYQSD